MFGRTSKRIKGLEQQVERLTSDLYALRREQTICFLPPGYKPPGGWSMYGENPYREIRVRDAVEALRTHLGLVWEETPKQDSSVVLKQVSVNATHP